MSINIVEAFATKNKCYQMATPLYPQCIKDEDEWA